MKPEEALAQYKNLFYQGHEVSGEDQKKIIIKFSRDRVLVVEGSKIELFKDVELAEKEYRLKDIKFSRSKKDKARMGLRLEFRKSELNLAMDILGDDLKLWGSLDE